MKTLGRRSLASFLRVALRIVQIVLYISIPVVALGCTLAILKSYGLAMDVLDMPAPPSPVLAWLFTAMVAVGLTCSIIVVSRLRAIFATLSGGDPFVPENAAHLRVIGITLAVGELARYAIGAGIMATLSVLRIEPNAEFAQDSVDLPVFIWFAVLTVLVLSEVFREGSRMRQEQQFTI